MSEQEEGPRFLRIDPGTEQLDPFSYDAVRAHIIGSGHSLDAMPPAVRAEMMVAIEYTALAYEQFNLERHHLFALLTREALVVMMRAFERALRERFGEPRSTRIRDLLRTAHRQGYLADHLAMGTIDYLIETRNAIAHADDDPGTLGTGMPKMLRFLIDMTATLFREPPTEGGSSPLDGSA